MTEETATEEIAQTNAPANQDAKLYVGNLPYSTTEEDLTAIFAEVGEVVEGSAVIIRDRNHDNRSKGFGFITMATVELADKAIEALNGKEMEGRAILVAKARPQEDRPARAPMSHGNFNRRDRY